ncbi:unnamed protein product [Cochlearia groenlandica]
MSSHHWDPNNAIVPFVLENMDPANDSSVRKRLKSWRATGSDHRCIRESTKTEGSDSVKDSSTDPKKNPKSSITSSSVAQISRTFGLPLSGLRIPSAAERLTDAGPDEIAVYEALFSYNFLGVVPSLVAEVSRYFGLSPGQLSPMGAKEMAEVLNNNMIDYILWKVVEKFMSPHKFQKNTAGKSKSSTQGLKWLIKAGTNLLQGFAAKVDRENKQRLKEFAKEFRAFRMYIKSFFFDPECTLADRDVNWAACPWKVRMNDNVMSMNDDDFMSAGESEEEA